MNIDEKIKLGSFVVDQWLKEPEKYKAQIDAWQKGMEDFFNKVLNPNLDINEVKPPDISQ